MGRAARAGTGGGGAGCGAKGTHAAAALAEGARKLTASNGDADWAACHDYAGKNIDGWHPT